MLHRDATVHPNVLNFIHDFRDLESFFAINYIQRKNGYLSKSFRRALDIKRDDILFNLKSFRGLYLPLYNDQQIYI